MAAGSARLPASLLASAGAHAMVIALALRFGGVTVADELPRARLIAVSLVSRPGGGGGATGSAPPGAPPPAAAPAAAATPGTVPPPAPKPMARKAPARPVAKRPRKPAPAKATAEPRPKAEPAPAADALAARPTGYASPGVGVGGGAGAAGGGGDGSGGDGSGGARPAYGSNPRPPYPLAARRLRHEGRVSLTIVVRPDGTPAVVTVKQSSGHRLLDEAAVDTVKNRWRFIPARRGGVPVESTVTVPIRFRLDEG